MILFLLGWAFFPFAHANAAEFQTIEVKPILEMTALLKAQDADRDLKITLDDLHQKRKITPKFDLKDVSGKVYTVEGTYPLSNLLQELKLASDRNEDAPAHLRGDRIFENPVARISRLIRDDYWKGLTRIIDRDHLVQVLGDSKVKSKLRYLYVPADDPQAYTYYQKAAAEMPALKLKVVRLPKVITPDYVEGLAGKHGLLALKLGEPYVVPGGRFNEMYGWDSYFEGLGLIVDRKIDLAQSMVDHLVYEIRHYGKILNANRTYYLLRSQPPFLPSFIRAVREELPDTPATREWLKESLSAAIHEYTTVWMGKARLTETGLSRYAGDGGGVPPEVEKGHFDAVLATLKTKAEREAFFRNDRAVRESGHDTTYRWRVDGKDRCADFVTVDLNSLLYKAELEIAHLIDHYFDGSFKDGDRQWTAGEWRKKAADRKKRMLALLWDSKQKLFFDYDFVTKKRSQYVSATTLYPLWAWDPEHPETRLLSESDQHALAKAALAQLEMPGGLAATAEKSLRAFGDLKHERQWDYPNGWAPHQILAWIGLEQSGMKPLADRLIYRWLYMITRNAMDYQGTIPEKYDVVKRSHRVFAEYGNVGTEFSYITREGFGWMNASYQIGLRRLPQDLREKLDRVVPPEWIRFTIPSK